MISSVFVAHEWENPLHANHYSELIIYKPVHSLRKRFCAFALLLCGFFWILEVNKVSLLLHMGNRCVLKKAVLLLRKGCKYGIVVIVSVYDVHKCLLSQGSRKFPPLDFPVCPRFSSYPDNWGQLRFPESTHDEGVSASSLCFLILSRERRLQFVQQNNSYPSSVTKSSYQNISIWIFLNVNLHQSCVCSPTQECMTNYCIYLTSGVLCPGHWLQYLSAFYILQC